MKPRHPTRTFLQRHRRRARGTLLLWSAVATLAALALAGLTELGWWPGHEWWTLATSGVAVWLLGTWMFRVRGRTSQRLARELDARWALHAHLESTLELADNPTDWAAAQREDATRLLAGRKPPGALAWRSGQLVLTGLIGVLLAQGTALALRSTHTEPTATVKVAETAPEPPPADSPPSTAVEEPKTEPPPAEVIRASIEWKTPEAEIKATAIEEVPLTAIADSSIGFRSFSLKMIINGDREISRALDPSELGEVMESGEHEIRPSLFLDELKVKPYDMVSYWLVAELDTPDAQHVVTSPPQFVQIRAPQEDAAVEGAPGEFPSMLFELKAGQLQLIKQNAALARLAATAESDPTWAPENARIAEEQDKLADRTAEVLAWARSNAPQPLVVANLAEARAQMKRASAEIAATANAQAAKPQNRALALLTELEKLFKESLEGGMPVSNPFDDEQSFELPPRNETPAGELEALAARQKESNAVLADGSDTKAEQAAIGHEAAGLTASGTYGPSVKKALTDASTAAAEAVQQLSFDDLAAARVPAAAAQSALEKAVEVQEEIGRADTVAVLEQVRRSLNTASRAGASERSERFVAARSTLRTTAMRQQTTGSAEAAQELAQLAGLIGAPPAPDSPGRVREVADAAAHAQVLLSERIAAVSRAVRLLNRVGQDLAETPGQSEVGETLATLELASQEAQWITTDAVTIGLAQQLAARADDLLRRNASNATNWRELSEAAVELATALEHGRANDESDPIARRFNAADIDPAYREAVESYFERLSREGRRAGQEN